ncbi:MAG: DNA polymerase IV [Myxococcales bacterium]|nr:DNA polymerase IV [Myxococcales bacterium]
MTAARSILHVDLDAFFAAVEQRDNPSLRGKPVIVGGSVRRGVVSASSYEARKFGVFSAMPMAHALRLCPHAIVVPHHMDRYVDASRGFFAILADYSPLVEGLSLDEAFVDLTGSERLLGPARQIAQTIKARVHAELQLVTSCGLAPSKFVAKIASDIDKPDGLREVGEAEVIPFLWALPTSRLWGAGKTTQAELAALGLTTIGDVARYPVASLARRLGDAAAHHLHQLALGIDDRDVEAHGQPQSVGHRETFDDDITDAEDLALTILDQADRVAARLRAHGLLAKTIVLTIKYDDFRQVTRQRGVAEATSDGGDIARVARDLLTQILVGSTVGTRVRLCGVTAVNLVDAAHAGQLSLDHASAEKKARLAATVDAIGAKFGDDTVVRAALAAKRDKS